MEGCGEIALTFWETSHIKMGEKGFSESEGSKRNLVHLDIGAVLLRFVITSKFSEI